MFETVIVMSLLLMFSFGVVEYGYAFYIKKAIQESAYSGARAAICAGSTNSSVQSAIAISLQSVGLNSSLYTVTTTPATITGTTAGTSITVSVSCNWGTVGVTPLPVSMGGIPNSKNLTCSVTMLHE